MNSFVYPRGTKELCWNSFKDDRAFQIELEFGNVGFCGTGRAKARRKTQQQTQPTCLSPEVTNRLKFWATVQMYKLK